MENKVILKSYIANKVKLESKYNKKIILLKSFLNIKKYISDNIITKEVKLKSYIKSNT